MSAFSNSDHAYMARALELAARGKASSHPNPRVGCVLVRDDEIVGEGWHRRPGEPHAEVNAIDEAGAKAAGSTAYVTLEPCSHHGRTPPCTDALIGAGVGRVVFALHDPSEAVRGEEMLNKAGIETGSGLLATSASALNRGFLSRVERGKPFVRLKMAASLDGRTAMASGESRWITGDAARADVQRLRAESGAILTGVGTVIADDPSLTVRLDSFAGDQPARVVLDSNLRTPPGSKLLGQEGETIIFCIDDAARPALETAGAIVERVAASNGHPDPETVLRNLAGRGINDLLVEAGAELTGALLAGGFVDELVIYQSPHIMGSETRGLAVTPGWQSLADRMALEISDVRQVGEDLRITATPVE